MGTSGNKAIAVTVDGKITGEEKARYPIFHPHADWAEQNTEDWWNAVCKSTRDLLVNNHIDPQSVIGLTFSSQTQNIVATSRSGKALRPAISWLDGRSADIISEKLWKRPRIMGYNINRIIQFLRITGGAPGHTGKDQIGKLLWLKEYEPECFAETWKFLDAKDYILYRMTGNPVTSTDLAYIWWMMDSRKHRNQWHPGLCALAGADIEKLPEIRPSQEIIGRLTEEAALHTGLPKGLPVVNGAGDLAAAALGSGALKEGEFMVCLGTSGWVGSHVKKRKIDLPHYTGCIGSANPSEYYLAMAHQETCCICLEWLKDHVLYHKDQLLKEYHVSRIYEILDNLAASVAPGADGLLFTPWMYGERCPIDDKHVRAGLFNIGLNHSKEHIVRAVLEGIALNTRWAMETLEKLYSPVTRMNMIGGGGKSDLWCQIMADVTGKEIHRVDQPQNAGARGVALLAAMTLGHISSYSAIADHIKIDRIFTPNLENKDLYNRMFKRFKQIYTNNKNWFKKVNP